MPNQVGTDWIARLGATQPGMHVALPAFGTRGGANSDGVLVGAFTPTALGRCFKALTGGTVFTNYTTAANNASTGDVTFDFAAQSDALYVGHLTQPFCAVKVKYTTAGSYSATTLWEYYNGTTWVNLATSNLLLDSSASSGAFKQTAGTYFVTFSPPSDWATTTVNSVSGYWVRVRVSAFTSVSTAPALDQLWVYPLNAGTGLRFGSAGTLSRVDFLTSTTLSASNADSRFLIVNGTTGASYVFTATKAATVSTDTTIALACATTDQLAVMQLQQDGSTEFAGVNVRLLITPT